MPESNDGDDIDLADITLGGFTSQGKLQPDERIPVNQADQTRPQAAEDSTRAFLRFPVPTPLLFNRNKPDFVRTSHRMPVKKQP